MNRPVLLLALTVAGISPACRQQDRDPDTVTLGVSMASFTAPYASALVREFKRYAGEEDFEILLLDSQHDISGKPSTSTPSSRARSMPSSSTWWILKEAGQH